MLWIWVLRPALSFLSYIPTYLMDIQRTFTQAKVKAGREGETGNAHRTSLKKKSTAKNCNFRVQSGCEENILQ